LINRLATAAQWEGGFMATFTSKLLDVDLCTQQSLEQAIPVERAQRYFLGSGLAASMFYERIRPDIAPLDANCPVYVFTGLLTGTMVPTACKFSVCGRSPLTGIWNESVSGGYWGAELRFAGYDGIAITGHAERPTYLWITESGPEFRDASHLWGLDCYESAERVRDETDPKAHVLVIGPAGERRVHLASIMVDGHEARAVGRGGMGAVFGAKNLKAIAVRGTSRPTYYDEQGLRASVREKNQTIRDKSAGMSRLGTASGIAGAERNGDLALKNWLQGSWPEGAAKITGQTVAEQYEIKHYHCFGCPIGCGKLIPAGKNGEFVHTPEYESVGTLGSMCLVDDLPSVIEANDLCNRLGLDTISTGAAIAAAMEAAERNLLPAEMLKGVNLSWGNGDTLVALTKQIGLKEGLGAWLGEGVRAFSRRLGPEAGDLDVTVKGLELPMHDPRAFVSMAANYATANRGACHLEGMTHWRGAAGLQLDGLYAPDPFDPHSSADKGKMVVGWQNYMATYNPLGLCKFAVKGGVGPNETSEWIRLALGWDVTPEELLHIGERIFNLKRLINARFGVNASADTLPRLLLEVARDSGGAAGVLPDQEGMLKEYYEERGWDSNGMPTYERLKSLSLA
jgi:aldehyde:ferredoxin oxidoreductase